MLTTDEKLTIYKEAVLGKPPSITTDEALEYRKERDEAIKGAKAKGYIVEIPNEIL